MKHIPASLIFQANILGPSQARFCKGAIWSFSLETRELIQIHPRTGSILSREHLSQIPTGQKVSSLGCDDNELWVGTSERLYSHSTSANGKTQLLRVNLPGSGPIRDIRCAAGICLVVRDSIWARDRAKRWSRVQVPPSGMVTPAGPVDREDPFANWQDTFVIAKGRYFRTGLIPAGKGSLESQLFLDPLRAALVVAGPQGISKWGQWGVWEGKWMSPKGLAVLRPDVVAISDVGTKVVTFFSVTGTYLGTLSSEPDKKPLEWRKFEYPLDIDLHERILFVTDFKANRISALELPQELSSNYNAPETPESLERSNLFRHPESLKSASETRCLSCHDGFVINSLEKFLKGKTHHAVGVEVKAKTDLPLDEGSRMNCATCHSAHHESQPGRVASFTGEWSTVAKAPGMLRRGTDELCASCHEEKTKPSQNHFGLEHHGWAIAPVVKVRSCTQCHTAHGGTDKLLRDPVPHLCMKCHGQNHATKGHPFGEKIDCLSCHSPHQTTRVTHFARQDKEAPGSTCLSCHKEIRADFESNKHLIRIVPKKPFAWNPQERVCLECHSPHEPAQNTPQLCLSCHEKNRHLHAPLTTVSETARAEGIHLSQSRIDCTTCHSPHGAPRDSQVLLPFCASCHGAKSNDLYRNYHVRMKQRKSQ